MPRAFFAWKKGECRKTKDTATFSCCLNGKNGDKSCGSCRRCEYIIPASKGRRARRCKLHTCAHMNYCHHHRFALTQRVEPGERRVKLVLKTSGIPNAGLGVFVKGPGGPDRVLFHAGDPVCYYAGEEVTAAELAKRYDHDGIEVTAPYGMQMGDRLYDSACARRMGEYINAGPVNTLMPERQGDPAVAARDIKNGEELFVSYGKDYFDGPQADHATKAVAKGYRTCGTGKCPSKKKKKPHKSTAARRKR